MADEEKRNYETEWQFSFANLGESLRNTLNSIGLGQNIEIKKRHFAEPLEAATEAEINLSPSFGNATLSALTNSDDLLQADLQYVGEVRFEVQTTADDTAKHVSLRQNIPQDVLQPVRDTINSFVRRNELVWDMRLTPNIPLDLRLNCGTTSNTFDLREVQLKALALNGGAGRTSLMLPTMGAAYPVAINSGAGELSLDIPDGANINLDVKSGIGQIKIRIGHFTTVDAVVRGGVGATEISVPADAGVRIHAASGLGRINIPSNFVQVKLDQFVAKAGIWETPNYANAEHVVNLRYEGGVGHFSLRLI